MSAGLWKLFCCSPDATEEQTGTRMEDMEFGASLFFAKRCILYWFIFAAHTGLNIQSLTADHRQALHASVTYMCLLSAAKGGPAAHGLPGWGMLNAGSETSHMALEGASSGFAFYSQVSVCTSTWGSLALPLPSRQGFHTDLQPRARAAAASAQSCFSLTQLLPPPLSAAQQG